jgi:hypothetical protein
MSVLSLVIDDNTVVRWYKYCADAFNDEKIHLHIYRKDSYYLFFCAVLGTFL